MREGCGIGEGDEGRGMSHTHLIATILPLWAMDKQWLLLIIDNLSIHTPTQYALVDHTHTSRPHPHYSLVVVHEADGISHMV